MDLVSLNLLTKKDQPWRSFISVFCISSLNKYLFLFFFKNFIYLYFMSERSVCTLAHQKRVSERGQGEFNLHFYIIASH